MGESGPVGQFVAGGTDLYPNMKRRQQVPKSVISVMRLQELNQIIGDGAGGLRIGASVTLTEIVEHPIINRDYPVVAKAARTISTPLLRNMGTIGGNLLRDSHVFEFFADFIRPVTEDGYDRFCTSFSEVVDAGFDDCLVPEG